MSRQVVKKVQNQERSEGVGAKVRRSIGFRDVFKHFAFNTIFKQSNLDDFLIKDSQFGSFLNVGRV